MLSKLQFVNSCINMKQFSMGSNTPNMPWEYIELLPNLYQTEFALLQSICFKQKRTDNQKTNTKSNTNQ
jgi:hypothetical protein